MYKRQTIPKVNQKTIGYSKYIVPEFKDTFFRLNEHFHFVNGTKLKWKKL